MCSIMGYCDSGVTFDLFEEGFQKTVSRGPDDSRIIDTGKGLLGFHRLAIMGLTDAGMQPFTMDGSAVVCNGEIYGFHKLKEELLQKGYPKKQLYVIGLAKGYDEAVEVAASVIDEVYRQTGAFEVASYLKGKRRRKAE